MTLNYLFLIIISSKRKYLENSLSRAIVESKKKKNI